MRRKHLRIIVCLLLTALALPLPPGGAEAAEDLPAGLTAASGFADTEGHWAWAYIELARQKGLVDGVSPTRFAPDEPLTRAAFLTLLYNCAGSPDAGPAGTDGDGGTVRGAYFSDVPEGAWYERTAVWALETGLLEDADTGLFRPDDPATREQMCAWLATFAGIMGHALTPVREETVFADDADIAGWARERVYLLQQSGIVSGLGDGNFAPKKGLTRAEAAAALIGYLRAVGQLRPRENIVDPCQDIGYEQLTAYLRELAVSYPWLIRLDSAGTSFEGRDIPLVRFGRGSRYLYTQANAHAREHQTANFLLEVLDEYAWAYENGGTYDGYDVRALLDRYTIVMLPRVNPDGAEIAQKGFDAAADPAAVKRMSGAYKGAARWKANAEGTDINRNFPCFWSPLGNGPAGEGYSGPSAVSAPETRAVLSAMGMFPYAAFLDIHMAGNVIYFCNTGIDAGYYDRCLTYAKKLCAVTGYKIAWSESIRKDQTAMAYARYTYRVPAVTVEITKSIVYPHDSALFDSEIWAFARDLFLEAMTIS